MTAPILKLTYSLAQAEAAAAIVQTALADCVVMMQVAGSIRRRCARCHDVDLVIWPKIESVQTPSLFGDGPGTLRPVALLETLAALGWATPLLAYPRIIHLDSADLDRQTGGVPIELYIAEPDANNFGALVQMRTGSARFNESLAIRARKMGMKYSAGLGIFRDGARVDDGTELGIFEALEMVWYPPEIRNDDYRFLHMEGRR